MSFDIVRQEDLFREGNSIFLAKFLAGADIDVNLTIFGPGMQTDMALGNHDKARQASVQRVRRFDIIQMNGTDLLHTDTRGVLVQHTPYKWLVAQNFPLDIVKLQHQMDKHHIFLLVSFRLRRL